MARVPSGQAIPRRRWRPEVALVLSCLVLPFGLFAWEVSNSRANALSQGQRDAEAAAAVLEQHARATLDTYKLVLGLLDGHTRDWSWEQLEASDTLRDYLGGLVRDYPQIGGLALIDAQGFIRVSTFDVPRPPPTFADRDYFVRLHDHDADVIVGERVRSRVMEGDVLNIARRRSTRDGSFAGILLVNLRPDKAFLGFWSKAAAPGTVAALVRMDGRFLARFPPPEADLTLARVRPMTVEAATIKPRFIEATSPVDGVARLLAFRKVEGFPAVIVHGTTRDAILRPWRARALREAALFGAAGLALMALALAVAHQVRRKVGLVDALAAEVERRGKAETELEEVLRDMVKRQEAERRRIAQDLHDSLGQHVAVLHLNASRIARAPDDAGLVRDGMEQQKAIVAEIGREVSRLAWELRPVWLDGLGLETALRTLVHATTTRSDLDIRLDLDLDGRRFGETVEAAVYRALREAITNVLKHASARHLDILLDVTEGTLRVLVEDDGAGFPPFLPGTGEAPASPSGGLGLRGIRERLFLVGGSLRIESAPGEGTALTLTVPI